MPKLCKTSLRLPSTHEHRRYGICAVFLTPGAAACHAFIHELMSLRATWQAMHVSGQQGRTSLEACRRPQTAI